MILKQKLQKLWAMYVIFFDPLSNHLFKVNSNMSVFSVGKAAAKVLKGLKNCETTITIEKKPVLNKSKLALAATTTTLASTTLASTTLASTTLASTTLASTTLASTTLASFNITM
jgi:hypothetical protein